MSLFFQPTFIWFLVAVAFLVAELMAPGFVAIFFTLGCLAASGASWLFGMTLQAQIIIFVVVSLVSLVLFRKLAFKIFSGDQAGNNVDDYVNERIGKTVEVTETIMRNRQGKVKLDGSFWMAVADVEMVVGDIGRVVSVDSDNQLLIKVEPV